MSQTLASSRYSSSGWNTTGSYRYIERQPRVVVLLNGLTDADVVATDESV